MAKKKKAPKKTKRIRKKRKKIEEKVITYPLICEACGKEKKSFRKIVASHIYCSICINKNNRRNQKNVLYFR
jgi:late competence protein required for DNA uptake (superfamily II DNA/RNA helicase)